LAILKDIAIVSTLNNEAGLAYESNLFVKQGSPTEAAIKVFAEKLGQFDKNLGEVDYTNTPTAYCNYLKHSIKKVAILDFSSERKTMSTVV
jgi:magnesium-transporting ATPase (P-type)